MPDFRYKSVNTDGCVISGVRESETENRLREILENEGLELIESALKERLGGDRFSRLKMKTADLANLLFQLGMQLRAGVSIVDALRAREGESAGGAQEIVRQRLAEVVEQGTPMSEGLLQFPKIFPGYVQNVVKVAERSGSLAGYPSAVRRTN